MKVRAISLLSAALQHMLHNLGCFAGMHDICLTLLVGVSVSMEIFKLSLPGCFNGRCTV